MRPKDQGTRFETWLVGSMIRRRWLQAERMAEKGGNDVGDIALTANVGNEWASTRRFVIEAKARANLNVHKTLAKAKAKVENADLPYMVDGTVVIWKKLTRKDGNERRTPDGEPIIVAMDLDTFLWLIQ